jgi:hypothetical protein
MCVCACACVFGGGAASQQEAGQAACLHVHLQFTKSEVAVREQMEAEGFVAKAAKGSHEKESDMDDASAEDELEGKQQVRSRRCITVSVRAHTCAHTQCNRSA